MTQVSLRLDSTTLGQALGRAEVRGPAVDPAEVTIGIVHLGIGAFHRAHQAVFTEDAAAATGETGWGILGVTQRSASVVEQLAPQNGLYGVLTKGTHETSLRVIGSVRDVAFPGDSTGRVLDALAAPTTHIVTLTVTEKGYRAGADGRLDLADDDVRGDLTALVTELGADQGDGPADGTAVVAARSPIGLLVRGLARRAGSGAEPITVVTCDNMVENGRVVSALVRQFLAAAQAAGEGSAARGRVTRVLDWIEASVRFPSTMVDRIVPATTPAQRAEASELTGVLDEGLVVAEPFMQWVIEDDFAGPRPAWEQAGATFTSDVGPFEQAKLRMLNATHSMLAYFGALKGLPLIADAVVDSELAALARRLLFDEVVTTLQVPDGLDLVEYGESILERFANPNTGHTTIQVAMDGSQKLPFRLFGTVADLLARGEVPQAGTRTVAAWLAFVTQGSTFTGQPLVLDDPRAADLRDVVDRATGPGSAEPGDAEALVDGFLALDDVFPAELAGHTGFRGELIEQLADLLARFTDAPRAA